MVIKPSGPNWASGANEAVAAKIVDKGKKGKGKKDEPKGPTRAELARRDAIRERASRRRLPWIAGAGVAAAALMSWGFVAAFAIIDVPAETTAAVLAGIALIVALVISAPTFRSEDGWWREALAAAFVAAGIVFWVGVDGPNWLAVLALLSGLIGCSARWWKAHAVGPGVAPLVEPEPEPEPEPEAAPESKAPGAVKPELDSYAVDWQQFNAKSNGVAAGSTLTNRRTEGGVVIYDVQLARGRQTAQSLIANAEALAGGLGLDREMVLFERGPRGAGAHMARLTIIENNPVADVRLYSGPQVVDGVIHGLGRYVDGRGEVQIMMWDNGGMKPTMLVGSTGTGKSAGANELTCGALSTGIMSLLYIDPKGNSSTALRRHARVAIIGEENALLAWVIVDALVRGRSDYASRTGQDTLFPSAELPGWMLLHDEFSLVAGDSKCRQAWCRIVNIVRSLGFWPVALNQALHEGKWGDDQTRSAFAGQVVAYRINSKSDDLIPGLEYKPRELPVDEEGQPIPGMAVQAGRGRTNVPARWDWLPSDTDRLDVEPPYRTSTALQEFDRQPDIAAIDEKILTELLGPAVDGRWVIGPGGTHTIPVPDPTTGAITKAGAAGASQAKVSTSSSSAWKPDAFGLASKEPVARTEANLTPAQTKVLQAVRANVTTIKEITEAAGVARSTTNDALAELAEAGLVRKDGTTWTPVEVAAPVPAS